MRLPASLTATACDPKTFPTDRMGQAIRTRFNCCKWSVLSLSATLPGNPTIALILVLAFCVSFQVSWQQNLEFTHNYP
jgi:hypothetical protein